MADLIVGLSPSNPPWNAILNILVDTTFAFALDVNAKDAIVSNPNAVLVPLPAPSGIAFR